MHHKIRLRDDPKIDSVLFFEDQMTLVALVKEVGCDDIRKHNQRDKFLGLRSLHECEENFSRTEFLTFKVFDNVKVIVETTTEFPLDIKCKLVIS